jgi:hypothetical protein
MEMDREGGCACGAVRYRLTAAPLIVHACHCRDCQKQTGSAFVLNMWIEKSCVTANHRLPQSFMLTAGTGKPHEVFFCGECNTRLWSKYHAAPGDTLLVRVGTLDQPERIEPDVHIFARSKLPWLQLPPDKPAFETFYKIPEVWPAASQERLRRNIAGQS